MHAACPKAIEEDKDLSFFSFVATSRTKAIPLYDLTSKETYLLHLHGGVLNWFGGVPDG